jgi:hypothetical protein
MRQISGNRLLKGQIIDYNFTIPSSWDELSYYQHAYILQVLHHDGDKFLKTDKLLYILFEGHWDILADISADDLHGLASCTNFIFNERPSAINKFPKIKLNKKFYLAPADNLGNIGFGEWCFVYQFAKYFRETNDMIFLDKLIATLYRLPDPAQHPDDINYSGDIREIFNENLIDNRARLVADIPEKLKLGIYTWFGSALFEVMERRPHAFPPVNPNDQTDNDSDPDDGRTWLTIFRELLGPKWGTTKELKYTNAMFVLDGLEETRIEYEKSMRPANS